MTQGPTRILRLIKKITNGLLNWIGILIQFISYRLHIMALMLLKENQRIQVLSVAVARITLHCNFAMQGMKW